MKLILRALAAFFATLIIFFLAFAFVKADINPFSWREDTRGVFVVFGAFVGLVAGVVVSIFNESE